MCKVFMIAGIKPQHQPKVKHVLEVASKVISTNGDDDGTGYAAITSKGKIYGEKWLNPTSAFKIHMQPKPSYSELFLDSLLGSAAKWKSKPSEAIVYSRFGVMDQDNTVAVILHTRNATVGDKNIMNVHPFFEINKNDHEDTAIIHNGSITNHHALTKKYSSCDSEVILHEYLKNNMNHNPYGVNEVVNTLKGEFTIGALSSTIDGENIIPLLDIFKHKKDLYVGYSPELETAIFSTWERHLEEIAREAGITIQNIVEVKDGYLLRLNAVTGERIDDVLEFTVAGPSVFPYGRVNNPPAPVVTPATGGHDLTADDIEETMDDVKKAFEHNNSEVFTQKYQTPTEMSKEEKDFMESLIRADNTNLRALKLVQRVMGLPVNV